VVLERELHVESKLVMKMFNLDEIRVFERMIIGLVYVVQFILREEIEICLVVTL